MAREIIVRLTDDYDRTQEATQTLTFTVNGTDYEIDLSDKSAKLFQNALKPWIDCARPAQTPPRKRRPRTEYSDASEIRLWARKNKMPVPPKGRIPVNVRAAYNEAHGR